MTTNPDDNRLYAYEIFEPTGMPITAGAVAPQVGHRHVQLPCSVWYTPSVDRKGSAVRTTSVLTGRPETHRTTARARPSPLTATRDSHRH